MGPNGQNLEFRKRRCSIRHAGGALTEDAKGRGGHPARTGRVELGMRSAVRGAPTLAARALALAFFQACSASIAGSSITEAVQSNVSNALSIKLSVTHSYNLADKVQFSVLALPNCLPPTERTVDMVVASTNASEFPATKVRADRVVLRPESLSSSSLKTQSLHERHPLIIAGIFYRPASTVSGTVDAVHDQEHGQLYRLPVE